MYLIIYVMCMNHCCTFVSQYIIYSYSSFVCRSFLPRYRVHRSRSRNRIRPRSRRARGVRPGGSPPPGENRWSAIDRSRIRLRRKYVLPVTLPCTSESRPRLQWPGERPSVSWIHNRNFGSSPFSLFFIFIFLGVPQNTISILIINTINGGGYWRSAW